MEISPREAGEGFLFENKVVGGAIPKEYIGPIENGVKEAMENGVVAGYPMVDIKVTVYDGSYHEVDSSEMAFKMQVLWASVLALLKPTRLSLNLI